MSSLTESNNSIISLFKHLDVILNRLDLRGASKTESILIFICKAHRIELVLGLIVVNLLLHLFFSIDHRCRVRLWVGGVTVLEILLRGLVAPFHY